jgi:hypothetical protein
VQVNLIPHACRGQILHRLGQPQRGRLRIRRQPASCQQNQPSRRGCSPRSPGSPTPSSSESRGGRCHLHRFSA